jgi:hypothetical protein
MYIRNKRKSSEMKRKKNPKKSKRTSLIFCADEDFFLRKKRLRDNMNEGKEYWIDVHGTDGVRQRVNGTNT